MSETPAHKQLRILLVEDSLPDAELSLRELRKAGFEVTADVVQTSDDFYKHLSSNDYDLVLADYNLPHWTGIDALKQLQKQDKGIPFILVTGTLGEETAVECIKQGATDYVLKDRLARLPVAVRRGLEEKAHRDERQHAAEALRESQRVLSTLMGNLPGMAYRCRNDPDWTMEFVSQGCLDLTGYRPADIIRNTKISYAQLIHPDDRDTVWKNVQVALEAKQPFRLLYRITTATGEEKWIWEQGRGIFSPEGELLALEGFMTDVTERKRAEEELKATQLQLIQSAKLESVGRLAAGVAHEVKNPLAVIQYGLGYLSQTDLTTADDKLGPVLEKMGNAVKRADRVIRGLLDFSAPSELEITPGELTPVVEQSLQLVHYEMVRARVTVVKALEENLPPIKLDRHKIEQVFVNIFMNAAQAMPDGGTLTVKTATKALNDLSPAMGRPRSDHFRSGDTVVAVEVEDTGAGIPTEKLDRVFDPFFTTKPIGEGTGLGLSVTRKIIELHGGIIDIRNRREGGVRVTLVFPIDGGQDDAEEADPAH